MARIDSSANMFSGSRLTVKLLAVLAVALIPSALLSLMLMLPLADEIKTARRVQSELGLLSQVRGLTAVIFEHRRAATDFVLAEGRTGRRELEQRTSELDSAIRLLEATSDRSRTAKHDVSEFWEQLKQSVGNRAKTRDLEGFWTDSARFSMLAIRFARALADDSGIGSDPHPETRRSVAEWFATAQAADAYSEVSVRAAAAARIGRMERAAEARVHRLMARTGETGSEADSDRVRFDENLNRMLAQPTQIEEAVAPLMMRHGRAVIESLFERQQSAETRLQATAQSRAKRAKTAMAWGILVLVVGFALTLLVTHLVARGLLRQIEVLTATLSRVAAGDAAARAPVLTGDEFGQLSKSLNAALDQVRPSVIPSAQPIERIPAEVAGLARSVEETADEMSVQAVNAVLRVTTGRDAAVAAEHVESLASRCAATARRLAKLANPAS